ncbi:MAG: RagB/SusD family nutrient uptake outer membrane protein [Bacteroidales bacterium]|nr:RagB/SusD family nutrient uptake outer membrane protein [Bacteroidales bacterium]
MKSRAGYRLSGVIAAVLTALFTLHACKDFLNVDNYFSDELKLDSVFKEKRLVEAYMWGATSLFPDEGQLIQSQHTPGPLATDEAFTMFRSIGNSYYGMAFVLGEINSERLYTFDTWGNMYKIIRKCNTILQRMNEAADMTTSDKISIEGYTRFIRAYAYYNLLIDFGPPALLGDEMLETNADITYYDRPRCTYGEAVEYICGELEKAALYMPATVSVLDFGRPTRGAALGLITRLRLHHASPLFNGGEKSRVYFGNWRRTSDGALFIEQTYVEKRWALAAAAAKRVMELTYSGAPLYRLHTVQADDATPTLPANVADPAYYNDFPNGAAGIDHYRSYAEMFNGEAVAATNPEYVWGRSSDALAGLTRMSFPVVNAGWNGLSVTQKVVDAYEMVDGHTIQNSSVDYPYSEDGTAAGSTVPGFSGYRFTTEGEVFKGYLNREKRFYASIGFCECFWPCESVTGADANLTVKYYIDAENGKNNTRDPINYPPTGYVIKKTIHPLDAWQGTNNRRMNKAFGIIRYAEILLSYAEALNNLTSAHTVETDGTPVIFERNKEEIRKAINQVRYRAGLPGVSDPDLDDPKRIQAIIEKERMVEFLHENRRYYDVRRWETYEDEENIPVTGMNMDANRTGFYTRVIPNTSRIGSRVVHRRLMFLPIPKNELRRLPSFDQNPGWDN